MDPILKYGSQGQAVMVLTDLLIRRGYLAAVQSTFDPTVRKAVKAFQAQHVDEIGRPLVVDGEVGPLTWWALRNPDNSAVPPSPTAAAFATLPPGSHGAGGAALAAAIAEMQSGAKEVGANNSGPWVDKYLNAIVPAPADWCAGFVSYCFTQAPGGIPFKYSLGARNIRNQFRNKGWAYDLGQLTPEPGDIVVWWRDQPNAVLGHIGLVHHVSNGILYTIEGNKGGFPAPVRGFNYTLSQMERLLGFGHVP